MTTYYVSPNGSDANNGLGPDASHASNKPWLTIGKALGASGIASGDTVYVGPGTYREVITVNMTSATVETSVLGDPTNAQGFKTSGGALLSPGEVIWTGYTTSDLVAPGTSTATITLSARDFLTFRYLTIIGADVAPSCVNGSGATQAVNITFRECVFICAGPYTAVTYTGLADVAANWTIDRCIFVSAVGIDIVLPTSTVADYDCNIQITNCFFTGTGSTNAININSSGANSFKGGGVDVYNCTFWFKSASLNTASANVSTTIPCTIYNCWQGFSVNLTANTSGQILEDYNYIIGSRTNVTAGKSSVQGTTPRYAPLLDVGQSAWIGRALRPFASPLTGAGWLGMGNQAGSPTVDLRNRPRPAGGGAATTAASTTGTATSGAGTTLTDSGATWTTNAFTGYVVRITGGTGSGQQRLITSNTGTVLTVPTWSTNPDNTSTYSIYQRGIDAAAGAHELHDTAAQETSTTQAGSNAIKIIGPGDHDFQIPVDASSTTISIYARYDSNHAATNKPQVILLANSAIGVSAETKTMTSAADTWEQLTFSAFTPTAKGVVTIRCVSRAAAGQGVAYFDTVAVA